MTVHIAVFGHPELGELLQGHDTPDVEFIPVPLETAPNKAVHEIFKVAGKPPREHVIFLLVDGGDEGIRDLSSRFSKNGFRTVVVTPEPELFEASDLQVVNPTPCTINDVVVSVTQLDDVPLIMPLDEPYGSMVLDFEEDDVPDEDTSLDDLFPPDEIETSTQEPEPTFEQPEPEPEPVFSDDPLEEAMAMTDAIAPPPEPEQPSWASEGAAKDGSVDESSSQEGGDLPWENFDEEQQNDGTPSWAYSQADETPKPSPQYDEPQYDEPVNTQPPTQEEVPPWAVQQDDPAEQDLPWNQDWEEEVVEQDLPWDQTVQQQPPQQYPPQQPVQQPVQQPPVQQQPPQEYPYNPQQQPQDPDNIEEYVGDWPQDTQQEKPPGWAETAEDDPWEETQASDWDDDTDEGWWENAPTDPQNNVEQQGLEAHPVADQVNPGIVTKRRSTGGKNGVVLVYVSYKGGAGKCLVGESRVMDPVTGDVRRLDEVVNDREQNTVLSFDGDRIATKKIAAKVDSGVKPTVRIKLASGRELTVTPHHPMLMPDGWRKAEDIVVGETVAAAGRIPMPEKPERLPGTEVDLLALIVAEGNTTIQEMGTPTSSETLPAFKGDEQKTNHTSVLVATREQKDYETMPPNVFRLPEDQLAQFLTVLWSHKGKFDVGVPSISFASKSLTESVQHLLLRFGLRSTLYKHEEGSECVWSLTVHSDSVPHFNAVMQMGGCDDGLITELMPSNADTPILNENMQKRLCSAIRGRSYLPLAQKAGQAVDHLGPSMFLQDKPDRFGHAHLNVRGLAAAIDVYPDLSDEFNWLASDELWWDRVVSVEDAGDRQVWDLTVPETHNFVADDVVVHNTTLSMMSAAAFAEELKDKSVVLVDGNAAQGSVGTIMELREDSKTILDAASPPFSKERLYSCVTQVPGTNLNVLLAPHDKKDADKNALTPELYLRSVNALKEVYDYVIVDTPVAEATGLPFFDDFALKVADKLIVVISPNKETIRNNLEWLDFITDPVAAGGHNIEKDRIGVIYNLAEKGVGWDEPAVRQQFAKWTYFGSVMKSSAIQLAANDSNLHVENSPARESLLQCLYAATGELALNRATEKSRASKPAGKKSGKKRGLLAKILD